MSRARPLFALAVTLSLALASRPVRADGHRDAASQPPAAPVPAAPSVAAEPPRDDARRKQVLVRGEGLEITVGEVEDQVARQTPGMRARYQSAEELKLLVASLVRAELLANEAARRGYEAQPQVRYLAKDSAAQALVRSEIDDKLTPEAIATEDVGAYYEAHPAEFHRVAMRRGSFVLLDSEAEAERLLPELSKADARAFAELAKQHSKDPETKVQGGDLGYFASEPEHDPPRDKTQPTVSLPVRKAVFALAEVGDTSKQPLALDKQRAIVRYTAERPERHVSLEDAALSIRAKLWRERRQKALDQLYAKLRARDKPQVFTDRIYLISFDDMEKRPSGFVPDPVAKNPPSAIMPPAVQGKSAP
ncbi:MAG: Peptidyl-prolyl cis-trans isomerase PpiD [Myxococcaceae bacterium]|nr:Peptidyl-prolyl cis-trans isomerase PpiD [Myxococcaceae bacterium]